MNKNFEIINLACYFNDKNYDETNIKTSNGFFYNYNKKTYLITTAHSIIDNWLDSEYQIADRIVVFNNKIEDIELKKNFKIYKYLDVLIAEVDNKFSKFAISDFNYQNVKEAIVVYNDTKTTKKVNLSSKYSKNCISILSLDTFDYSLDSGVSGAPVFDNNNNLISMITSESEKYKSKTICIPIFIINKLLDIYPKNLKFSGLETQFLSNTIISSLSNKTFNELKENNFMESEIVQYSMIKGLEPLDIICKINDITINNDNNLFKILLENQTKKKIKIEVYKLKKEFKDKYLSYPRRSYHLANAENKNLAFTILLYNVVKFDGNKIILKDFFTNQFLRENTLIEIISQKKIKLFIF